MRKRGGIFALVLLLTVVLEIVTPFLNNVQAVEEQALVGDIFKEDVNLDGKIDINDVSSIANSYNSKVNDGNYKAQYDIDDNKIIDLYDLVKVSNKVGTNAIPYRVYKGNNLVGRFKSLDVAKKFTAQNKNYHILDGNGNEVWRSRYEAYNGTSMKGRFNTLNEAKASAGNIEGAYVRDSVDNNKVVWQYVDPTVYGIVTASTLNVRSGPGTNYGIIGKLSNGQRVVIVDSGISGWYKIKYGSGYGYVSKEYMQIQKPIPPPVPPLPGERRVVIDPGHGGHDPGAVGSGGTKEKDVVLIVGLKVRDMLKAKGYDVIMTRDKDVFVELLERRNISNSSGANFFVSIHANAYNSTSRGTETFGNPNFSTSWEFAKKLQRNMVNSFGLYDRGVKDGTKLAVIKENNVPAALVELAFISNPNEEALLKTDSFQTKAAQAIVKSIEESY